MKLGVTLDILNQKDTPAFYADTLSNRPAAGFTGRVFISTDTLDLYRDTGTTWVLLSPSSTGTITGSGAAGQVSYFSGASSIAGSNDLFFDSVNGHLGIGTITPSTALTIFHDQNQIIQINQTTATNDTKIVFQNSGTPLWRIGNSYGAGTNRFVITDATLNINRFSVLPSSGQTFVGDVVTSSGLFVVNSSSSDAHIVALGATAPSIRVRNAGTGASLQIGLGLSTTTNNFIQGSTGGEFCIFNDSLTAQPILFGIKDVGSGNTLEAARISAVRNLLVGTTVDSTFRLDVSGTIRGTSSTEVGGLTISHTNGNTFQTVIGNGSALAINQYAFRFASNQLLRFIPAQDRVFIEKNNLVCGTNAQTFNINGGFSAATLGTSIILSSNAFSGGQFTGTSGTQQIVSIGNGTNDTWIPSSGNATYNVLNIQPVINTSGTYAGIVRGLLYNPTLTSITGVTHRAIETTTGDVCFNTTSGSTLIGTTINSGFRLDVSGNVRVTGTFTQTGSSNSATFGNGLVFDNGVSPTRIFGSSGTINYQVNVLSGIQHRFTNQGSGITSIGNLLQIDSGANLSDAASNLFIIYNQTTNPALFSVKGNGNVLIGTATSGASKLRIVGLPTSAVGLSSGDVYSNAGILTIVP